jgi:hypothetical protein
VIGPFRRRSSWPSSLATGLIGWVGFAVSVALAFGYAGPLTEIFLAAVLAAGVQVVGLRLMFSRLRMDRGIARGAMWGGISAALIVTGEVTFVPLIREHPTIALLTGLYVGMAVGSFLSYFHRDDRDIEAEANASGEPVDYGRDAHWLDPFVYGAVSYEVVFFPRALDAVISAGVVGMIVGVLAAGVSHFILSRWKNASRTIPASTIAGIALGILTGFLFRQYVAQLWLAPLLAGGIAGGITFLITAVVGRWLARREREAHSREGLA